MADLNKTLFDCQQMFRHACAFAEVADMAQEKFCHDTADISWYTTPATVNSAFACEVFLKALLKYYDKEEKHEHSIRKLYETLPDDLKDWIKQTTKLNNGGMWIDAAGFDLLDNIAYAFIDWRYIYEGMQTIDVGKKTKRIERASHTIYMGFLTAFRNALREACCQLFFKKTWEDYKAIN